MTPPTPSGSPARVTEPLWFPAQQRGGQDQEASRPVTLTVTAIEIVSSRMTSRWLTQYIVEDGTHAALMAAGGTYAELYTLQARGYV